MLRVLILIFILTFSFNVLASQYRVQVTDHKTGEVAEQICADENELSQVTNYVTQNADEFISMKVNKLKLESVNAIKRGGGEGGGD